MHRVCTVWLITKHSWFVEFISFYMQFIPFNDKLQIGETKELSFYVLPDGRPSKPCRPSGRWLQFPSVCWLREFLCFQVFAELSCLQFSPLTWCSPGCQATAHSWEEKSTFALFPQYKIQLSSANFTVASSLSSLVIVLQVTALRLLSDVTQHSTLFTLYFSFKLPSLFSFYSDPPVIAGWQE